MMQKGFLSVFGCALVAVLQLLGQQVHGAAHGDTFTMAILHMNDHHSFLEEDDFDVPVADIDGLTVPEGTEEVTVFYGGLPRIKTVMEDAKSFYGDTLVKLHAGDALVGTSLYTLFRGDADADLMKLLCFDAFTLGNHEFDDGDAQLAEFITELRSDTDACDTKVLSANLVPSCESPLAALFESGELLDSTILTVAGEDVGIVGINIRNKTLLSSNPDEGTTYLDEIETAKEQVEILTAAGINKIILLTHIGYENDINWMVEVPGVDVVVGGDSHSLLGDEGEFPYVGTPTGPYPTSATAADGRLVCVLQAWEFSHLLGLTEVTFDGEGNVIGCEGTTILPFDPERFEPEVADPSPIINHLEFYLPFFSYSEDEEAKSLLGSYLVQIEEQIQTVICEVDGDICFERIPGQGRSTICPVEASAARGGGVCNLVAQAFLDQTPTADVAIQNGGGCRTDIESGPFTFEEAYALLPFSNTLVTLTMTGLQIALVLNQAVDNAVTGSSGAYPYAAGLLYDVDLTQPPGARVRNIDVNSRFSSTWEPLDPSSTYTIVTNSFIASGRDGYFEFAEVADDLILDTYTEYATGFIKYCEEQGVIRDPPLDTYSTKSFVGLAE